MQCSSRSPSAIPHLLQHIRRRQYLTLRHQHAQTYQYRSVSTNRASAPSTRVPPILPRASVDERARKAAKLAKEALEQSRLAKKPAKRTQYLLRFLPRDPELRSRLFYIIAAVPIVLFLWQHAPVSVRTISGPSMKPTINPDCESDHDTSYSKTWALISSWSPNTAREMRRAAEREEAAGGGFDIGDNGRRSAIVRKYRRGDVVVFHAPHDPNKFAVKRIVAVAGDIVTPISDSVAARHNDELVVPYNHLWVEGDVGDLRRSVDSNYYGPISEEMVYGKVAVLWRPWWAFWTVYSPHTASARDALEVYGGKYVWPAKRDNRVRENAVLAQTRSQDAVGMLELPVPQRVERILHLLRDKPDIVQRLWKSAGEDRRKWTEEWLRMQTIANRHQNRDARGKALEIQHAIEIAIGKEELEAEAKARHTVWRAKWKGQTAAADEVEADTGHFKELTAVADPRDKVRQEKLTPAATALKKMQEQTRRLAEDAEKEYEIRDKDKELRESQAGLVWPRSIRPDKSNESTSIA